jgi:hypothetical protein
MSYESMICSQWKIMQHRYQYKFWNCMGSTSLMDKMISSKKNDFQSLAFTVMETKAWKLKKFGFRVLEGFWTIIFPVVE